ncbi:hypothetical protein LDENG_00045660, partial [Lucifuga dentata]
LRSSGSNLLTIANSNLKTKGDLAFAVRAPKLWNDLLEDLRLAKSVLLLNRSLRPISTGLLLCDVIYIILNALFYPVLFCLSC